MAKRKSRRFGGRQFGAFKVFHRTGWTRNSAYPNGLEPSTGRKHTIAKCVETEAEARDIARVWNANHKAGKLSDKAEYMGLSRKSCTVTRRRR